MNDMGLDFLMGFVRVLPELAIFIACVLFLVRTKRTEAILLSIGSFIGVISIIFHLLIWPHLLNGYEMKVNMLNMVGVLSFFGSLAFITGFIILILNTIKEKNN